MKHLQVFSLYDIFILSLFLLCPLTFLLSKALHEHRSGSGMRKEIQEEEDFSITSFEEKKSN